MAKFRLVEEYDPIDDSTVFWIEKRLFLEWRKKKCSVSKNDILEKWERVKSVKSTELVVRVLDKA
jgi:hypothetical protein